LGRGWRGVISERLVALQDESGETDDTGEASTREGSGLASTGSGDGLRGTTSGGSHATGRGRDLDDGGLLNGDLRDLRLLGLLGAVVADLVGLLNNGLGDGARAVGDGDGTGLLDGDGLVAVDDLRGERAVGDVLVDDLGDDGDVLAVGVRASGGGSEDSGDSELHVDGIRFLGCVV
jgi:hypothetical protein